LFSWLAFSNPCRVGLNRFPGLTNRMFHSFFHLLSLLTFQRLLNLLKNEVSYYFSRVTGNPRMAGLPWSVSIEPTTSCNLQCPECPSGLRKFTRPTGSMSIDSFKGIIDQLSPHLIYLTLYFQGEPMLNRSFFEMVKYAKQKRIFVATSTNGHFLDDVSARNVVESGLDRLIISLDGMDQSTYEKYRVGGKLDTVLNGIANIMKWKKELKSSHPYVELQFLVLGTNEKQLDDIKRFAKSSNVNKLSLKSAQLYNFRNNPLATSIPAYSRYKKTDEGNLKIKNSLPNRCHRMWHAPVITWDGKLLPCCFDKDAGHILGDLKENSFGEIWRSPLYKKFRNRIFISRKEIKICSNCTEGLRKRV
jgi:radical SAM protein with 4Fe4S-binding SPASM domain